MSLNERHEWIEYHNWCNKHMLHASFYNFINWLDTQQIPITGALKKALLDHKRDSDITIKSWETRKENGISLTTK